MPLEHSEHAGALRYRPHIDGLRAIAVIAVILYHAKLLGVVGGFIGVDIFFVISGFLITSIMVRDLRGGSFSLLGFWERRVRRILPALTVVMLCSSIAAYFIVLYPYDYHHFGSSVIAQSVFASNMLFMVSDNYFDQPSIHSPLLHTWTLSVEEQFYLLLPLIVLLSAWLARRTFISSARHPDTTFLRSERILLISIIVLSAASFLLNILLVNMRPGAVLNTTFMKGYDPIYFGTAGFYLIFTRAWEFGLGAIAAILSLKIRSPLWAETMTVAGIVSILGSIFLLSDATSFPGIAALFPTVGAMIIIMANDHIQTKTGRVLSYAPLVWIGLISYSLYLWHWPVLVFAGILSPVPLSAFTTAGLLVFVLVISWLSYRFVEKPLRNKKGIIQTRKAAFALGFGSMAALLALGFLMYRNDISNANLIPPSAKATLAMLGAAKTPFINNCFQLPGDQSAYGGLCRIGNTNSGVKPKFIVWGDSHTEVLIPFFDDLGRRAGMQGVVFFDSSCIPVIGIALPTQAESCARVRANALQYIRDKDIKNIFLGASWSSYVMGGPFNVRGQRVAEPGAMSNSPEQAKIALQKHLTPMVQRLVGGERNVYIMKQTPEQPEFDPRKAFYKAVATGKEIEIQGITSAENTAFRSNADAVIDSVAKIRGVYVIDPSSVLCSEQSGCPLQRGEVLLYRDNDHVSPAGAALLEPLFEPIFERMR